MAAAEQPISKSQPRQMLCCSLKRWSVILTILFWISQKVSARTEDCLPALSTLSPITLNDSVTFLPEGDFIFPELQFLCNGTLRDFNLSIFLPVGPTFSLNTQFYLRLYQYTGNGYAERASFPVLTISFNNLATGSNGSRIGFTVETLIHLDFPIVTGVEVLAGDVVGFSPTDANPTCSLEVGSSLIRCSPVTVLQGTPIAIARESSARSHPIVTENGPCWEPGIGTTPCTRLYMMGRPYFEVDFVPTSEPQPFTLPTAVGVATEDDNQPFDLKATISFIGLAGFFGLAVLILLMIVLLMAFCVYKRSKMRRIVKSGRDTSVAYRACSKEDSGGGIVGEIDMATYPSEGSASRFPKWTQQMKTNTYNELYSEEGDVSTFVRNSPFKSTVKESQHLTQNVYDYPSTSLKGTSPAPALAGKKHSGYSNLSQVNENHLQGSHADRRSVGYDSFVSSRMEISRGSIIMGRILGEGEFGTVFHGNWSRKGKLIHVAVKVCNETCGDFEKATLLKEAEIVGQFSHDRVVKLYGLVSLTEPNMLVLEYVQGGSLESHLQRCREFSSQSTDNISKRFLKFCHEIADGMRYLSYRNFVHRDLAARNILLDKDYHCKIADFGLTRHLSDSQYYSTKNGGRLPLRWTSPESILYNKFSIMGDVWTYGIVMYEIWSLGQLPYTDFTVEQIIQLYRNGGYCLPPPPGCPRNIYKTMVKCWNPQYHKRPMFQELYILLSDGNQDGLLCWSEEDRSVSTQADVLGAPLEEGNSLYRDLQNMYNS